MTSSTSTVVTYEKRDRVGWVTLNRPEAMNAINLDLAQGLDAAMKQIMQDDDVLVGVMVGGGGRAFSAGMDLKMAAEAGSRAQAGQAASISAPGVAFGALTGCTKPLIAAIDGYCLAGGMQMASRCDIRIATRKSRFGMPEARRSLAAVGMVDTPELFLVAGEAAWILLTGGHMSSERAYQMGFIQQLVEDRAELMQAAEAVAGEVKLCAPLATQFIKKMVRLLDDLPTPPQGVRRLAWASELLKEERQRLMTSEDNREGPLAFAEKRSPVWKGR